ncbi:MAG: response regulator [Thermoflexales bacterium]|nr:response regulator [Thermoflexales bacterium]
MPDELLDMQKETFIALLVVTWIIGVTGAWLAVYLALLEDTMQVAIDPLGYGMAALIPLNAGVYWLAQRRFRLATWIWVCSLIVIPILFTPWASAPHLGWLPHTLTLVVVASGLLISRNAPLYIATVASALSLTALGLSARLDTSGLSAILPALAITWSVAVFGWVSSDQLITALIWVRHAQQQADERAELLRASRDELGKSLLIRDNLNAQLQEAHAQVTRLYESEHARRQVAEEASRLKSRLLSTVSHELRTPLNLIVGLSEMLLQRDAMGASCLPDLYRQDIARIHASAQHLDGLIRDVLDLARSEVGQLQLVCEPLNLAEVLHVTASVGAQLAYDKGLAWRCDVPADLPPVWGDRTRLRQVTLNLISNAVKFTTSGEVALRVELGQDALSVVVSDTGLGIPIEEQALIFDEFRQSERTTARGYGGLGLGLAISRRLAELHGGTMSVCSSGAEGAGSTFRFTLPLMRLPQAQLPAPPQARERVVLLLKRRDGERQQLCQHLLRQGFDVNALWLDENEHWLSQLLAAPPGAVVLDTEIATEQGWELLRILKNNPATQDTSVLFYSLIQERDHGVLLEMDYLTKPVGTAELAQALKRQGLPDGEKSILVVDDEPGILEMHARIVQAQSSASQVLKARNGREALESMRQKRPDLVLLDLMMPEMNGFEVLEAMQSDPILRDIPVIVLTGQVLAEKDMARLNQGVASVLAKGLFSVEETLAHVEQALARKQKAGGETRRLVRKAMAYLHAHYAEEISIDELARFVGLNKHYLARSFRQETGVSPLVYLNRYRVNQAKALLTARDKSVAEVAREVGFSDSAYFSQVFRRETGVSPTAYKQA